MANGKEITLKESDFLVSETDGKGYIVMANPDFVKISGFTFEELLGQPHNILRHKDMPKAAFKDLWATIKSGKVWTGYVKNATKNGDYYWAFATVSPLKSKNGIGYISCRKQASPQEIAEVEALYRTMS